MDESTDAEGVTQADETPDGTSGVDAPGSSKDQEVRV